MRRDLCWLVIIVLLARATCGAQVVVNGNVTLQGNITLGGVSLSLASSLNPSTYASSVTFTATAVPSTATGSVTFYDGATSLGTASISSGTAAISISTLAVGTHSITAAYTGNGNPSPALAQTVNQAASSISLSSSANPSAPTQSVTFTATVTPNLATGIVTFYNAGVSMGTGAISSGMASITTSTLGAGSRSVTASYSGDGNCGGSNTPSPLVQIVNAGLTISSTLLSANTNLWYSGQAIIFTATVTPTPPNGETITFYDTTNGARTSIGNAPTANGNGTATLNISLATVAQHSITASYPGDATLTASTSNALIQNVGPFITGLSLPQGPPQMGFVITGLGFPTPCNNCVALNGANAAVVQNPPTPNSIASITVQVPAAGSGPVVVTVNGIPSNGVPFTVTGGFGCQ